jgi:ubiquinone/menaquinone biosynthesis C-methylase UbiE
MSKIEFHPRRAWRTLWSPPPGLAASAAAAPPADRTRDLKAAYVAHVDKFRASMPHDEAMAFAVGGHFELMGEIQAALLRHYGLKPHHHLVDVGCGSGRLALPMSRYLTGTYLGIDLVPDLVTHAEAICDRPDWRFEVIDHIAIPEADERADMVCFFSVMTHLLHEQSFWYLQEARRVLKPGGVIVFSFLEFKNPGMMPVFWATLRATKANTGEPLNVFMDRDALHLWADALALEFVDLRFGDGDIVPEGALGQSICVLRKAL